MQNDITWSDQYREAGEEWADKEAAASLLEECRSAVMAQEQTKLGDIPVNRAEQIVKASPMWKEYNEKMVKARQEANLAKVRLEATRMKFLEWNNVEANARAEMRM